MGEDKQNLNWKKRAAIGKFARLFGFSRELRISHSVY